MRFNSMRDLMDHLTSWRIPGNTASIYLEGKEVFSYQSGYADLENKIPMTPEHMLNIYSCSKVATIAAALQLYEKGCFLLDDPLYAFIPEFTEMSVLGPDGTPKKAGNAITLRHLFTMTSGLNYNTNLPAFQKARARTNGNMDTIAVVKCLAEEPLDFEPGTRWQYSFSHDVLAAVIESISGQKFRDYMHDHIFEPLGMMNTVYHNENVQSKMAQLYRYESSAESNLVTLQAGMSHQENGIIRRVPQANPYVFGIEYDSGGAGITTTVKDYVLLCAALAGGGVGVNGERILSRGSVELLKTNQLNDVLMKDFNWPQLKGYGYGLGVRTLVDVAASGSIGSIGEFGWGGAAGASVYIDTKANLAMFYAHHMLNPQEPYYQPRVRNVLFKCLSD